MIPWLDPHSDFPPLETALDDPNGLLAASDEIGPGRLLQAYRRGIFPWYSAGQPVLWWSPDPRMVLFVDEFRVSRSLSKAVRQGRFELHVDTAFRTVMEACAQTPRPGQGGTWITSAIIDAYVALHRRGNAHSVEAWQGNILVGGLYGVCIGRMFFGESMFAHETDASKVALAHLVTILRHAGMPMIDCQQETPHLASMGARPISRAAFAARLATLVNSPAVAGTWPAEAAHGGTE